MKIAVASGKGGTGKTTVALALAEAAAPGTCLLDCDVEEPNCRLFAPGETVSEPVGIPMPVIDPTRCNGCGECACICRFHAIAVLKQKVLLFPELCHGCGGCVRICPTGALTEQPRPIGETGFSNNGGFPLLDGRLGIGQTMAPPLIRAVKDQGEQAQKSEITIIDCPPGTACPMVTAVRGVDFVLLVTEPTPFGLHDLKLAVEALKELSLPAGVIINRADSGDARVRRYCMLEEHIPILLEIPARRDIAEAYSRGETLLQAAPDLKPAFKRVLSSIREMTAKEAAR